MEKRNSRIEWAEALVDALLPHLDGGAEAAVRDVLGRIDRERDELRSDEPRVEHRDRYDADAPPLRRALRRAVDEIAGLVGKEVVHVDVISPRLLADVEGEDVPALLAGEFMGDFGGFLREDLRHSDFLLGYESGRIWIERAWADTRLDDAALADVLERVDARSPGDWRDVNRGSAALQDLPWGARLRLARFGLHVMRVLAGEILGDPARGMRRIREKVEGVLPGR